MIEFEERRSGNNVARIAIDPGSIAAVQDRDSKVIVTTIGGGTFVLAVDYDGFMEQLALSQSKAMLANLFAQFGTMPDAEDDGESDSIPDPGDASPEDFIEAAIAVLEDNEAAPDPAPFVPDAAEEETQ